MSVNVFKTNTLVGCGQFKLAQTSSDQLLVHMTKRNSMACHVTSNLDFDQGGYVSQIEWTKVIIANPCSKLLCMEVREVYQISRNQTLVFRT